MADFDNFSGVKAKIRSPPENWATFRAANFTGLQLLWRQMWAYFAFIEYQPPGNSDQKPSLGSM